MSNQIHNPFVRYIPYASSPNGKIACIEISAGLVSDDDRVDFLRGLCQKYFVHLPFVIRTDGKNNNSDLVFFGGTKEHQDYVANYHREKNIFMIEPSPLYLSEQEFEEAQTDVAMTSLG